MNEFSGISKISAFFFLASLLGGLHGRIPFYEGNLKEGALDAYLGDAHLFLDENSSSPHAPRVALDLLMIGKLAEDFRSVKRATDLLLFDYLGSVPSLFFASTFDKGSDRLTLLLKHKTEEGDLSSSEFAQSFSELIELLAKMQGPELMQDPALLLRSFLICRKSENEKLREALLAALQVLSRQNNSFASLIETSLSENPPLAKIRALSGMAHPESAFCIRYQLAQIDESERNSTDVQESLLVSRFLRPNTKPEEIEQLIASLPPSLRQSPKYLVLHALSHLRSDEKDDALSLLKNFLKNEGNSDSHWQKTLVSLLEGLELKETRLKAFLEKFSTFHDLLNEDQEAIYVKGHWLLPDPEQMIEFILLVDKGSKGFEVQFRREQETLLAYRVRNGQSHLLAPDGNHTEWKEASYPLPSFEIARVVETGNFHYSFNLNNFTPVFEDLLEAGNDFIQTPYLSTSKGREVWLNYLLKSEFVWISSPEKSDSELTFLFKKLNPDRPDPTDLRMSFSDEGHLKSMSILNFRIDEFRRGKHVELPALPQWPVADLPIRLEKADLRAIEKALIDFQACFD